MLRDDTIQLYLSSKRNQAWVMTGDAYLFHRLGGFSGGVLLDEPLLPASSLTRNTRNNQAHQSIVIKRNRRANGYVRQAPTQHRNRDREKRQRTAMQLREWGGVA